MSGDRKVSVVIFGNRHISPQIVVSSNIKDSVGISLGLSQLFCDHSCTLLISGIFSFILELRPLVILSICEPLRILGHFLRGVIESKSRFTASNLSIASQTNVMKIRSSSDTSYGLLLASMSFSLISFVHFFDVRYAIISIAIS